MENTTTNSNPSIEIIDRKELRRRLRISEAHCIRLEREGVIKNFRLGYSVRFNWQQVVADLQKTGGTQGY